MKVERLAEIFAILAEAYPGADVRAIVNAPDGSAEESIAQVVEPRDFGGPVYVLAGDFVVLR